MGQIPSASLPPSMDVLKDAQMIYFYPELWVLSQLWPLTSIQYSAV